jgi:hypothetical protein
MRLSGFSGTTVSCLIVPLNKNKNNADDHRPAAKRKRTLLHACRPCPSGEGPERAGSWWPAADAPSVEEDRRRRRGDLQHGRGAVQTPRDHSRLQEVQGPSERTDLSSAHSSRQYVTSIYLLLVVSCQTGLHVPGRGSQHRRRRTVGPRRLRAPRRRPGRRRRNDGHFHQVFRIMRWIYRCIRGVHTAYYYYY